MIGGKTTRYSHRRLRNLKSSGSLLGGKGGGGLLTINRFASWSIYCLITYSVMKVLTLLHVRINSLCNCHVFFFPSLVGPLLFFLGGG